MVPSNPGLASRVVPRLFDERTVVEYLVRHSLIDATAAQRVAVSDLSTRNRNFAVRVEGARGFFVKQAAFAIDAPAVDREAQIYEHLGEHARHSARPPRLRLYDVGLHALVVDLVPGGKSFGHRHRLSAPAAAALGRALATLHRVPPPPIPEQLPWALSADRPGPDVFRESSPAGLKLLTILQGDVSLRSGLDRLRKSWRPSSFAHGDVRWANVLAIPNEPNRVHLVDFEYAGPGDPHADVGTVLGEYLARWLDAIDLRGGLTTLASGAPRSPLETLRVEAEAFWFGYADVCGRAKLSPEVATAFAATRLIELAFEQTSGAWTLGPRPLLALQLAANLLTDPRSAARELFGWTVESP